MKDRDSEGYAEREEESQRERESSHYFSLIAHKWPSLLGLCNPVQCLITGKQSPPQLSQEGGIKRPWKASTDKAEQEGTN